MNIEKYFPDELRRPLRRLFFKYDQQVREICFKRDGKVRADIGGDYFFIDENGIECDIIKGIKTNEKTFDDCFLRACEYSLYSRNEELCKGFVTLDGGHRVGVGGGAVYENEKLKTVRDISFLNYRIARAFNGCSDKGLLHIIDGKKIKNTVIASSPGCGKTTFIRDLALNFSKSGIKACIIDTRHEIAAVKSGKSSFDVGDLTAVLDGYSKVDGLEIAIRTLSPKVIICDEIGKAEEFEELKTLMQRGVNFVITVHCSDEQEFVNNKEFFSLFRAGIIENIIFLKDEPFPTSISKVLTRGG